MQEFVCFNIDNMNNVIRKFNKLHIKTIYYINVAIISLMRYIIYIMDKVKGKQMIKKYLASIILLFLLVGCNNTSLESLSDEEIISKLNINIRKETQVLIDFTLEIINDAGYNSQNYIAIDLNNENMPSIITYYYIKKIISDSNYIRPTIFLDKTNTNHYLIVFQTEDAMNYIHDLHFDDPDQFEPESKVISFEGEPYQFPEPEA